jgi:hypothetical protein
MPKNKAKVLSELSHGLVAQGELVRNELKGALAPDGSELLLTDGETLRIVRIEGQALRDEESIKVKGLVRCGFAGAEPIALYDNGDLVRGGGKAIARNALDASFSGDEPRWLVKKRGGVLACVEGKKELWGVDFDGGFDSAHFAMDGTACAVSFRGSDEIVVLDAETGEELGELYDSPDDGYALYNRHLRWEASTGWTRMTDGKAITPHPLQLEAVLPNAVVGIKTNIGSAGKAETFVFDARGGLRATYSDWLANVIDLDEKHGLATVSRYKPGTADLTRVDLVRFALDRKQLETVGSVDFDVRALFATDHDRVVAVSASSVYLLDCA